MTKVETLVFIYMQKVESHRWATTLREQSDLLSNEIAYGPNSEMVDSLHKDICKYHAYCSKDMYTARETLFAVVRELLVAEES